VQLDVAGVSTVVIDTGGSFEEAPLLLLHGSVPGVTAAANWRG
jgi:2-hydroxymuconate-semialdehyde hydrolase